MTRLLRWAVWAAWIGATATTPAVAWTEELPAALQRMIESRSALNGAEVEWSYTQYVGNIAGAPRRFLSRYSHGGDQAILQLPPEVRAGEAKAAVAAASPTGQGSVPADAAASPAAAEDALQRIAQRAGLFAADGRAWLRGPNSIKINEHDPEGADNARAAFFGDVRTVGMSTQYTRLYEIGDGPWAGVSRQHRDRVAFEAFADGPRTVVIGTFEDGSTITWNIRPDRGWNAERVTMRDPSGEVVSESIVELERSGETWFPARAEFHFNGKLVHEVVVHEAEFESPAMPHFFTLADMGAEVGMEVTPPYKGPRVVIPSEQQYWDGEQVLFLDEFQERLERGEIRLGPAVVARRASAAKTGEPIPLADALEGFSVGLLAEGKLQMWDAYTRQFIRVNKLDETQTRDAERVLRDCKDAAQKILDDREEEIRKFVQQAERAKAESKQEKDPKKREARFGEIWERQERLFAFLDEMFQTRLKPGLDSLLTADQRAAAEARRARAAAPREKPEAAFP